MYRQHYNKCMDKENLEKDLVVRVPPTLFAKFKLACNENYKTASEAIRDLMQRYIKENSK